MELKITKRWSFRLRRLVVGCGAQADEWLAMAVRGRPGYWEVEWAQYGERGDKDAYEKLAKRVWRRPFYVAPWEAGIEKDMPVSGVDLRFLTADGKTRPKAVEVAAAVRTQMMSRYAHAADPSILCNLQQQGPDGSTHWVGAVALQEVVKQTYREWNSGAEIINPHVSSNAAALANTYLALYPEEQRAQQPVRLLILTARGGTHAVLMDGWRLLDSLHYEMVGAELLDPALVEGWIDFFASRNDFKGSVVPLVTGLGAEALAGEEVEIWRPMAAGGAVKAMSEGRSAIDAHADLATLALGMALQGG